VDILTQVCANGDARSTVRNLKIQAFLFARHSAKHPAYHFPFGARQLTRSAPGPPTTSAKLTAGNRRAGWLPTHQRRTWEMSRGLVITHRAELLPGPLTVLMRPASTVVLKSTWHNGGIEFLVESEAAFDPLRWIAWIVENCCRWLWARRWRP